MNQYIEDMKRRAKAIAREGGIGHQQALDAIARQQGHAQWGGLLRRHEGRGRDIQRRGDGSPGYYVETHDGVSVADRIEALVRRVAIVAARIVTDPNSSAYVTRGVWVRAGVVSDRSVDVMGDLGEDDRDELNAVASELDDLTTRIGFAPRSTVIHAAIGSQGLRETILDMRATGCVYWHSVLIGDIFTHKLWPTGEVLVDYLPDTPNSWKAAHGWAILHMEGRDELDPTLWGLEPSGLLMIPEGGLVRPGVGGCLYRNAGIDAYDKRREMGRSRKSKREWADDLSARIASGIPIEDHPFELEPDVG